MNVSFFLVFILGHLVGDFVLQTNKVAIMKSTSKKGVFIHSLIVFVSQAVLLSIYGINGIIASLLNFIIHYSIDSLKENINKHIKKYKFIIFVLDQIIHIVGIYILSLNFGLTNNILMIDLSLIKILITIIVLTYVSSVMVIILIRDIDSSLIEKRFFKKKERIIDALTNLMVWLLFYLPLFWSISLVILLFYFYQKYQKEFFDYNLKIIAIKYFVFIIISYLFLGG
ncbi:DUF3307 domain-containing protein [Tepidibacter hydrothermalis]|uniref:DUF3307 domain-containing protein n=1 Tax=Tepidibacter hydrothermalis TaxID=3036126 RepID=A0ABY8EFK4_9FIRM|nr:DUF3307 domain-containing protein [Tepidibacter hydrothermalis]WFD10529.1 DUF3307 domain-containing protein [Tepidibacter hydrothermalis]